MQKKYNQEVAKSQMLKQVNKTPRAKMFVWFDRAYDIQGGFSSNVEKWNELSLELNRKEGLLRFIKLYMSNQNEFVTPYRILKFFRYHKLERATKLFRIIPNELGLWASIKIQELRIKFREDFVTNVPEIKNESFGILINTWTKLEHEISHKKQYKILEDYFLTIVPGDVKWIVRFLTNKVKLEKELLEVVENARDE